MSVPTNLIVTINTEHDEHPSLVTAKRWMQAFSGRVHLVTSVYDSIAQYAEYLSDTTYASLEQQLMRYQERRLDAIQAELEREGIFAQSHVRWAPSIAHAIHVLTQSMQPCVVIKRCSEDAQTHNPFATAIDRQCLRSAYAPMLLVKRPQSDYQKIMVAINPFVMSAQQQAQLDALIEQAKTMQRAWGCDVQFVHFYQSPMQLDVLDMGARDYAEFMTNVDAHHECLMTNFAQRYQINPFQCRVFAGDVKQGVAEYCSEQHADLLMIGTASRQGLEAWLHGNIAEEILRKVDCDIYCVPVPQRVEQPPLVA